MTRVLTLLSIVFIVHSSHGQLAGAVTALNYDGVTDHAVLPDNTVINDGDFTIEFWFKSNVKNWRSTLLDISELTAGAVDPDLFFIAGKNNKIRVNFTSNNGTKVNLSSQYFFEADVWYHVACVGGFNRRRNHELYVNGILVASNRKNTDGKPSMLSPEIRLGGSPSPHVSWNSPFNGAMDEIRFWNTARTQQEIVESMCLKLRPNTNGLVRYFKTDESFGSTLIDATGNGNATMVFTDVANARISSGVPLGDEQMTILNPTVGSFIELPGPYGNKLRADITSATFDAESLIIYLINATPNVTTPPGSLTKLSDKLYYGVKTFGGSDVRYSVTYNYAGHPGISNENDLTLAKRDNNADPTWEATNPFLNTTDNTLTLFNQSGTQFILGTTGIDILPVELISFEARSHNFNQVQLEWSTASEKNNAGFSIQRSVDAQNWENISWIEGAGNSATTIDYAYLDENPIDGMSYYRLKQVDHDGASDFGPIRSVELANTELKSPLVYPNPASTEVTISLPKSEILSFDIYDFNGRDKTGKVSELSRSESALKLDVARLAPGTYMLNINGAYTRFVKQ